MTAAAAPISNKPKATIGAKVFLSAIFAFFLVLGSAFEYALFLKPVARIIAARTWRSATCEILSSRVHESSAENGSVYRADVTYRYEVDGSGYVGDRYKFMTGSSSGRRGKAAIVASLPRGARTTCYVNPADPTQSVIDRGFTADLWYGLLPMLFILAGGVGLYFLVFGRARLARAAITSVPLSAYSRAANAIPAILEPKRSRRAKLAAFTLIALFWNGIVSVFVFQLISAAQHGRILWFLGLFLIPFVLVGFFLVAIAVQQAMAMSNPRPTLRLSRAVVSLGDEVEVTWEIDGRVDKLRGFSIELEGREEATYRRGTTSVTDREVFARFGVVEQLAPAIQGVGRARVTIPARTMHSFDAPNNKIVWVLRVRGEIPSWPDSDDEFPLTVGTRR